jgi:hypothetical protein
MWRLSVALCLCVHVMGSKTVSAPLTVNVRFRINGYGTSNSPATGEAKFSTTRSPCDGAAERGSGRLRVRGDAAAAFALLLGGLPAIGVLFLPAG